MLETNVFIIENRAVIEAAMFGCSSGNADFADHVILESARQHGVVNCSEIHQQVYRNMDFHCPPFEGWAPWNETTLFGIKFV